MRTLVLIPARGTPLDIPRKNLRSLGGRPLLAYPIRTALASRHLPDVYVSSEDEEILYLAQKLGARIHRRARSLSMDGVSLDLVVQEAYEHLPAEVRQGYDVVVTMLPTSPLLTSATLDAALDFMAAHPDVDTLLSARKIPFPVWGPKDGHIEPLFEKRVSRQTLAPFLRETGGFVISRRANLEAGNRVMGNVRLHPLENGEEIDLDSQEDWSTCEFFLSRKRLVFVVCGTVELGLGHVYRSLLIANELPIYDIVFLMLPGHSQGEAKIRSNGYPVHVLAEGDLADQVLTFHPSMVINDILDTERDYVLKLKAAGVKVINFEDLGPGAIEADATMNAVYQERSSSANPQVFSGYRFFCVRDEFLLSSVKEIKPEVSKVLLTFGGADEKNLTLKVLKAILPFCRSRGIRTTVVAGSAYQHLESLSIYPDLEVVKDTSKISEFMLDADIIFSSAGGTTFEIACLGVPTIVLAQNQRELTHRFASPEHGFVNLGLGTEAEPERICKALADLADSWEERLKNRDLMLAQDVRSSRGNVIKLIKTIMGAHP